MGNRRMFSKRIINSARFLKMPVSTQCLYFHLGLHADDDGVVEAYTVINSVGASEDDLKVLVAKGFVIVLNDDLVTYITDWTENNTIRADRKIDSIYQPLLLQVVPNAQLQAPKERADVRKKRLDNQWTTNGQPMDSISKDKLSKDKISKENNNNVQNAEAEALFDELWLMYPSKKGKGQVSMTAKKKLLKIGADEMRRAIVRYKDELAKDADWRKPQNGSTFFNSGYVDYLDDNYQPAHTENDNFYEMAAQWAAE